MNEGVKQYGLLFWNLFKTDLLILRKRLFGDIIDSTIWVGATAFIFAYIFPKLGVAHDYGAFYLVGALISVALFEVLAVTVMFVSDFKGNNTISYQLTLPIPSWLIFVKCACGYMCISIIMTALVLPFGKLFLGDMLDFSQFSLIKFSLMLIVINLFTGFFSLFISSIVKNVRYIRMVWRRIVFPLWILGGRQVSWHSMNKFYPEIAYLCLANPITYAAEGIRAAVLGQQGYLSFEVCLGMTFLFSLSKLSRKPQGFKPGDECESDRR